MVKGYEGGGGSVKVGEGTVVSVSGLVQLNQRNWIRLAVCNFLVQCSTLILPYGLSRYCT